MLVLYVILISQFGLPGVRRRKRGMLQFDGLHIYRRNENKILY